MPYAFFRWVLSRMDPDGFDERSRMGDAVHGWGCSLCQLEFMAHNKANSAALIDWALNPNPYRR
jgi:hypothetical protein